MEITTRLPEQARGARSSRRRRCRRFDLYGTRKNFMTSQTGASLGNRFGKLAVWASGNYQKSNSQPLGYVTSASFPTGTTGAYRREEQARRRGQRARRERAAAHRHDERQDQGGVRHHADAARVVHVRALAERRRTAASSRTSPRRGSRPTRGRRASRPAATISISGTRRRRSRCAPTARRTGTSSSSARRTLRLRPAAQRRRRASSTGTTFGHDRAASRCSTAPAGRRSTSRARGSRVGAALDAHA